MFSLFRRKREAVPAPAEAAAETRLFHHSRVPDAADLVAHLSLGDESPPVRVELLDMSIQGAGVAVPFHLAPDQPDARYCELVVRHARDDWRVSSLARVTRIAKLDGHRVHVGLQFLNLGDLYAQLNDALGRYFNRRSTVRVAPAEGETVGLRIEYQHHRLRGAALDVSSTGVGVRLTLVQAAIFKTGERVVLKIELPGAKAPLTTPATVQHGYRLGENVVLGLEFEHDPHCSLHERRGELLAYVAAREAELAAQQERLVQRS